MTFAVLVEENFLVAKFCAPLSKRQNPPFADKKLYVRSYCPASCCIYSLWLVILKDQIWQEDYYLNSILCENGAQQVSRKV